MKNDLLKYGLNFLIVIVFTGFAAVDCTNEAYGSMVIDLAVVFVNCFALLFIQNAEKIETLKKIEEELEQQNKGK